MRRAISSPPRFGQYGVTLVEMIVAIVVTGILLSLVGMFTRNQIASYFDLAARTELADAADTALRRMARDLQAALPNSVRVSGNYLEFVPIKDAGRYRAQGGGGAADDPLDFSSSSDNTFDVFGPAVTVSAGDQLVIYNLGIQSVPVSDGSDVYDGSSRRALAKTGSLSNLKYAVGGTQFPFASPQNRFHIVSGPVTLECAPNAANPDLGTITRRWCYAYTASQPTDFSGAPPADYSPTCPRTSAIVVSGVSECHFSYQAGVLQRNGLVSMRIVLSRNNESVTLLHQVDVMNTP